MCAFDTCIELGMANERQGRLREAIAYVRRAAESVRGKDAWACGLALTNLANPLTNSGQPTEAVQVLVSALDMLEQPQLSDADELQLVEHLRDPRRARCLALADLARALAYLGDLDRALELAVRARAEEERLDIRGGRSHRAIAQVELARGRPAAALDVLVRAGSYGAVELLGAHRAADLLLLAQAQLGMADPAASLQTARDGIRICERSGAHEHLAGLYVAAGWALLARDDSASAMDAAQRSHALIDETGTAIYRPDALRLEAEVARVQGGAATERLARKADVLARSMGLRMIWPTTVGSSSHAVLRAASEDHQLDGPARPLSKRELEVLALVAEGHSNRSIAESLFLSDKTVKRHLSNILDKLGVSTRAAAVSHSLRLGLL